LPTYEYQCNKCKAVYELRQGFDADTKHTCEECGKGVAKRILHAPPIVFKGGGWYATDSRSKTSALSESDSSAKSETASESKPSETKAEKSESKPASKSSASESTPAS
jgi:putative FmdB family regulatory protein